MSKAIGNDKSDILIRVELELWKALLNVATGRDTIFPAMRTFYRNITEEEIEAVSIEDRQFFSAGIHSYCILLASTDPKKKNHRKSASLICLPCCFLLKLKLRSP